MERHQLKDEVRELAAIVKAAKAGDESALPELISRTEERLFRFLLFLCGDEPLANDLCQDVYLYVFESLSKLEDPEAFLHWLFRIARNKFLDHRKSPRNKPHAPVETLDKPDPGSSPEQRELVIDVRKAFAALEPDDRVLLILIEVEGVKIGEAAEFMKISEAAATSRLRRARAAFHKKYFAG